MKKNIERLDHLNALQHPPASTWRRLCWFAVAMAVAASYGTFLEIPRNIAVVLGGLTLFCAASAYESVELMRRVDQLSALLQQQTSATPPSE